VVPLWCDLIIETEEDGSWRYAFSDAPDHGNITEHYGEQLGNNFSNHIHIKIMSPWIIKEKTGVDFYLGQNTWGMKDYMDDVIVPPGVLNFRDQHSVHTNIFLKKKKNRITIPHDTPLFHCIPLSTLDIKLDNRLVTDEEYKHLGQEVYYFSFMGAYKNRVKKLVK